MLQELESKLGVGGRGVVAEMVASPDKEQPPAVLQREREREWGSVCIEGGVERERGREERGIAGSRIVISQDNRRM